MTATEDLSRTDSEAPPRPIALAVFLVIAGVTGLIAAFELMVEKIAVLEDPSHSVSCDFSVLVGCSTNLASEQGAVLGFPNPIIGLVCWPVVITIGMALLSGARFSRWFWIGFNVGVTAALGFVCWLIFQSIYVLDVLCPWCMLTWAVTIPTFWAVTLRNVAEGVFGGGASVRRIGAVLSGWIPLITVVCYLIVVVQAQLRMDAIPRIWFDLFG
ncbi:hypothetical protein ARHIZOSPH14_31150 [Agromyces rhizosphaerae]|uniref:Vitamin K epoxide reductase domain-containing protein n=1 Tax=Agromyces rhizosphaerae TaxID=88374 RepID=A0A9W6CUU2_9MICO|nr:vitamin K epoxide reductase family protein [Agromyces rhizosphaerae]GLI28873.1 hypothetical protein ARHIZOSPH14_31150 [Agromyces rhizosphaerae]